jgi:hypothetical protein
MRYSRRAELSAFDGLFEQVGRPGPQRGERAAALAGSRGCLREEAYRGYCHAGSDLDDLARHLEHVRARVAILERCRGGGVRAELPSPGRGPGRELGSSHAGDDPEGRSLRDRS